MKVAAVLLVASMLGCLSPSIVSINVDVSVEDFIEYWTQLIRRWPIYFDSQCLPTPELPSRDDVHSRVRFEEVSSAVLATCTFTKSTWVIKIGDDKWASGCVPHELGHAACQFLAQPDGCEDFEHVGPFIGCET